MWHLKIECISLLVACVINPDPVPQIKLDFQTKAECERAMDNLNTAKLWEMGDIHWRPTQGAWKMNCVQR